MGSLEDRKAIKPDGWGRGVEIVTEFRVDEKEKKK